MSRHLMAKMRNYRTASVRRFATEQAPWVQGRPLCWANWAAERPEDVGTTRGAYGDPLNHIDDHHSAIVHHGEQRYALEIMPNTSSYSKNESPWTWGIHQYHNPSKDQDRPEHWNWTSSGEWDHPEGSPALYYGNATTAQEAKAAAEHNWDAHKAHVDAQNPLKNGGGGYDINDIMREQGF